MYPYSSATSAYAGAPAPSSPYQQPPPGGRASPYGAPAPASSYAHSPYAAPAGVPAQGNAYSRSPYTAPATMSQAPPSASTYPHSPYAGSTASSTLAPSSQGGYYSGALSPRANTMQFPPAGATTTTTPAGGQITIGAGAIAAQQQPFGSNVQPGAITYTTTTDQLGRVTYHHFRYRSPQGVTYSGIQWLPTETSTVPPVGVAPAGPEVIASFRGQMPTGPTDPQAASGRDYRDDKAYREKDKEERRRRKREEKEAGKRAAWDAERRAREKAEEHEIRKARERDAEVERTSRTRRMSTGAGLGADLGPTGYERERSRDRGSEMRERERERDLERRMGDLNVGGHGLTADYGASPVGTRSRRQSMSMPAPGAPGSIYDDPGAYDRDYERERSRERPDNYGQSGTRRSSIYGAPERPSSFYGQPERAGNIYAAPAERPNAYGAPERQDAYGAPERPGAYGAPERSPYRRATSPLPPAVGPGGVPVYPAGHIYEGRPIPGAAGGAPSRSHSPGPIPGTAPYPSSLYAGPGAGPAGVPSPRMGPGAMPGLSPRIGAGGGPVPSPRLGGGAPLGGGYGAPPPEQQLLGSPEAFSRAINRAQTFTPFSMLKVQDMEDFLDDVILARPPVLGTHDVQPEDWGRLMNDIGLAWKGRLPLPTFAGGPPPKRSDLIIDLLDLWNTAFFLPRGVELTLYRGRTCLSGPTRGAKLPEALVPSFENADSSESGSSDESDGGGGYGAYGGRAPASGYDRASKRKFKLEEKVRRAMERKELFKRGYTLYLQYVPPREY
ncbi:hypothetical protein M0805_007052 [Coniferiporia weirii]|nr:hypothetical protein M0805_007052 [Coniferiporia weirii]